MMRRFYRLRDDVTVPGRWHVGEIRTADGVEPLFFGGRRLESVHPLMGEVTNAGRALAFSLTSFAVPVASNRLATEVSAVGGADVQCFPLKVADLPSMWVLNSTRVIRCLDESRSEFIKWTSQDYRADLAGQYQQVTKLTVDVAAIPPDAHFFRIEGWHIALIVSEEVKEAMERVGCLGATFSEVTPQFEN